MNIRETLCSAKRSIVIALFMLILIGLSGCIVIEVPPVSESVSEPRAPESVRRMEDLGYTFIYHSEDDPFWEARNSTQGWTFRIWEDDSFGMSGQFDKDNNAQTEASIDFFESLGVSPEQASFTVELTVKAMGSSDGEASACEVGLCCNAQVISSQQMYIWYCGP